MKNRNGFTLLELVVAVVVLGVLAAIALPQYTAFVERGHLAEALSALDAIKTGVMAYRSTTGGFPTDLGQIDVSVGVKEDFVYVIRDASGACVWQFQIMVRGDPFKATEAIIVVQRGDSAPPPIQYTGFTMHIDVNGNIKWVPIGGGAYPYTPQD